MIETATSNPIKATNKVIGKVATNSIRGPIVNIGNKKPAKILSNVCPATRLAKRRIPSENALAT